MKPSAHRLYTKWLVIDGFNLIYKFDSLHSHISAGRLEEAMSGLLSVLDSYRKKSKKEITVVFDGKKREGCSVQEEKYKGMKVLYSLSKTADEIIMKYVKEYKTPADLTIISSDKQIISYVKRYKSKVMISEHFEELVRNTPAKEDEHDSDPKKDDLVLSGEELSFWEKMFTRN